MLEDRFCNSLFLIGPTSLSSYNKKPPPTGKMGGGFLVISGGLGYTKLHSKIEQGDQEDATEAYCCTSESRPTQATKLYE